MFMKAKKVLIRYFFLTVILCIAALSFNILIAPLHIVIGGNNGVAVLIEYIFKISPSKTLTVLSVFFVILSFLFLSKEKTMSILYASFIYPILVNVTYPLSRNLSFDIYDMVLLSIYIGIISGFTNGMILKLGFNNGGINVISNILYKYYKISYSKSMFVINALIVAIGGFYIGTSNILYAIIILYINSYVVDKVLLNKANYKCFQIITRRNKQVEEYITNQLKRTYTKIKIKPDKVLLLTVIKTKEYITLKEFIKQIDKDAFFLIQDSYDAKIKY